MQQRIHFQLVLLIKISNLLLNNIYYICITKHFQITSGQRQCRFKFVKFIYNYSQWFTSFDLITMQITLVTCYASLISNAVPTIMENWIVSGEVLKTFTLFFIGHCSLAIHFVFLPNQKTLYYFYMVCMCGCECRVLTSIFINDFIDPNLSSDISNFEH